MGARPDLERLIFDASIPFEERALAVFRYQRAACPPYKRFCDALEVTEQDVKRLQDIPYMPISVFKEVDVCTVPIEQVPLRFRSSATGGVRSTHWVAEPEVYRRSIIEGFRAFYGDGPFYFWSYTPGYSENPDSSLIWMIEALMDSELCSQAYRHPICKPLDVNGILSNSSKSDPIILIGAAFGLLDLIELGFHGALPENSVIIETGGMKTRKRERTREELHRELSEGFGLPLGQIHSEYGMAEMLTQAWRKEGRRKKEEEGFRMPHWARVDNGHWTLDIGHWAMDIDVPDTHDPRSPIPDPRSLITDLANLYSCSFLISGDRMTVYPDGSFEVHGRVDETDFRGCNFLMERD